MVIKEKSTLEGEGTFTQDEVVEGVEVTGVLSLECYLGCFSCKGKLLEEGKVGKCLKCGMVQRIYRCTRQKKAKVVLSTPDGGYLTLLAFGSNVTEIAGKDSATAGDLIGAAPFTVTYYQNVMTGVGRPQTCSQD